MHFILFFTIVGILSICSLYETKASTDSPQLNAFLKTCQEKTGASNRDYELIKMRKMPSSEKGICMVECIFVQFHIIENGKFNRRGFVLTFSPAMKGDFRKISKLNSIAEICEKEVGTEPTKECETTRKVLSCLAQNEDQLNLSKN